VKNVCFQFYFMENVNQSPSPLIKETNIAVLHCNLCNQFFKSV